MLACLAVTRWALERARSGEGPTLIEAFTYRMGAHTTSDDPTRYRADEEREAWEAKDPIPRLRAYLESARPRRRRVLRGAGDRGGDAGQAGARGGPGDARPGPDARSSSTSTPTPHALVDEERAQFAAYQASFADAGEGK